MRTGTILFCAVLFLVAGCAELPRPATFPYSFQKQLQSASHWQRIAELTTERLNKVDVLFKREPDGSRHRIYIQDSDKSPFGEAFRKYLITELITAEFPLSDTPDAPIRINWDLQLVRRNVERPKPWLPGLPNAVVTAAWIATLGKSAALATAVVASEAGALLLDPSWNTTDLRVPHTELILTTWVTVEKDSLTNTIYGAYSHDKGHIVEKDSMTNTIKSYSDTFYINDRDRINYNYGPPCKPVTFTAVSR